MAALESLMLGKPPGTQGDIAAAYALGRPAAGQSTADQLTAAGLIIARLVSLLQQPRPHDAPLPWLPNEIPATMQVPAMHLLQAAGLDMHGRRVEEG